MKIPIFQVDSFTSRRFKGNPAAVCPLGKWIGTPMMQKIAAENNLAETAFFVRETNGFHIRWFTPKTEVDLCGHATLAAAAVAFEKLDIKGNEIVFNSKSGLLKVRKEENLYVLDFPSDTIEEVTEEKEIVEAIGRKPEEIWKGREDHLLIYGSEVDILAIKPDFRKLTECTKRGVIVSAPGNNKDFVSRFFAPAAGIDEDYVTGSAHTTLIPYWSKRLNKTELSAMQISSREGSLNCKYLGDRVEIGGEVVFYLEGLVEF
ncbi:MAG: PhzF family phenazine biosynthesis protein [Bacteroidales bacterium]|nr:PhzF family phenazine biosynthesis protein [Bacteroidales bacterium]MCF8390709.1 PhzF family phenazine biosynthesis protein [Bacteroidales bacterium]